MLRLKTLLFFILIYTSIFFNIGFTQARPFLSATPSVSVADPVYDDLDVLVAHGLIKERMLGQRPYTRSEIARLITVAEDSFKLASSAHLSQKSQDFLTTLLADLKTKYAQALKNQSHKTRGMELNLIEKLHTQAHILKSPARGYFENPLATFNPLVNFQGGRHYRDGYQTAFESEHSVQALPYFSFYFRPRFQLQFDRNATTQEIKFFVQELYATATFFNTQIDIGRKELAWGQSRYGGLMLSNHARPLDGVQLHNPEPWDFGWMGLFKYSFFFAHLGPEYVPQDAYMAGGKVMFMPTQFLEFALSRAIIFEGQGLSAPFFDYVQEFFGARIGDINTNNLSNSISGFELRGKIPPLRNMELYAEFYFDDVTVQKIFRSFKQDTGIIVGLNMPRLDSKGSLSLRLEGRTHNAVLYKHSNWVSGWTINGNTLGDPLGADADAFSLYLTKRFNHKWRLLHEFHFEIIQSDTYLGGVPEGRRLITDGPAEKRVRGLFDIQYQWTDYLMASSRLGYERVQNFNFVPGTSANNLFFSLNLVMNVERFFKL